MNDSLTMRALADRQAITDLIHLYCRAVDRMDVPLGRSIWHDGSHADYGAGGYQGEGRDAIDHICMQHAAMLGHAHQVTNILIDLTGDSAGSEAYFLATLRMMRGGQEMQIMVWGRYLDRWSRRDGRWGIDRRLAVRDFDEIREVRSMARHGTGRRGRDDPSYAILPGIGA